MCMQMNMSLNVKLLTLRQTRLQVKPHAKDIYLSPCGGRNHEPAIFSEFMSPALIV